MFGDSLTFNSYFTGYMDVAIGTTEDNFTVMAVVADEYFHAQDHQKNYTVPVVRINLDVQHYLIIIFNYHLIISCRISCNPITKGSLRLLNKNTGLNLTVVYAKILHNH